MGVERILKYRIFNIALGIFFTLFVLRSIRNIALKPSIRALTSKYSLHTDASSHSYTDIFDSFNGREQCGFSSMDLHVPSRMPLCQNRSALLTAMSEGGRGGFDAPYIPRGCDLKFFKTHEICEILDRFEGVIFLGDSMMRHVLAAVSMLLREDLAKGGQQHWEPMSIEGECICDRQVELYFCHKTDITSITQVYEHDPVSVKCSSRPNVQFKTLLKIPLDVEAIDESINTAFSIDRPPKPYAIIYGTGLWNDLNLDDALTWIDEIQGRMAELRPYLLAPGASNLRLFVSPSAMGEAKQEEFLQTQNNKAIMQFEKNMRKSVANDGLEFFGTWNMSIQGTIPDGTHSGIRTNILKAMTVINWLDKIDVNEWNG